LSENGAMSGQPRTSIWTAVRRILGVSSALILVWFGYLALPPEARDEVCRVVHRELPFCAQPIITNVTPRPLEQGETAVVAVVKPNSPDEELSIRKTNGLGDVSLAKIEDDVTQNVVYRAPAQVRAGGPDLVAYIVSTRYVTVKGKTTIQLNLGPKCKPTDTKPMERNQTATIAVATPGSPDKKLSVIPTGGTGTIRSEESGDGLKIIYEAPPIVKENVIDTETFTVSDTHVTAPCEVRVQLDAGPTITNQPPKSVEQKQKLIIAVVTKNLRGDEVHLCQTTGDGKLQLETAQN
jgi:hypothetical protein